MDTCRWNPGSAGADGHFATGISWVWILPQGKETIYYQADFLLCSWVAFMFLQASWSLSNLIELKWKWNMVWTVSRTFDWGDFSPRNLVECYFGVPPVSLNAAVRFQGWLLCFPVTSVILKIPMEILAPCIWAESWGYFWKFSKCPSSALHLCLCAEALALA